MNSAIPHVSVLMPTFRHAAFIRRALESLRAQTLQEWELVIVDDNSPDETSQLLEPYLADPRVRYERLEHNHGLGAALNHATQMARGKYLAYLPSDDLYYPKHLELLAALLDRHSETLLAYAGVRWGYQHYGPAPDPPARRHTSAQHEVSPDRLVAVQIMHRRAPELCWPERSEIETDMLEGQYWAMLAERGPSAYSSEITCEWVDHATQRHKLIAGEHGGLACFRSHYGLGRGEWLNWQPSRGMRLNEQSRYGGIDGARELPDSHGLKILLVGELGFNPERILAFEEHGHKLYGLWIPQPERWDTTGHQPYGNIEDIPYDRNWPERVQAIQPDVIYALLNWQSLHLIDEVLDAGLAIPLIFHFKEGPFICQERGLWPILMRVLAESDGRILLNQETLEWFQLAIDSRFDPETVLILDGDMPKVNWMTDDWTPKLSAQDGQIHTVCSGRPLGLDPFDAIAAAGIHVHFYGEHFQEWFPNWTRAGLATGFMHLHPSVEPANWVRELSQYDAAWFHVFQSKNGGDLRQADWDDLNLPARMGTYAAAGLPWILKANHDSRVAVQSIAQKYDIGVLFKDFGDLAERLRNQAHMAQLTANMCAARNFFAFDTHIDALVAFFRQAIARRSLKVK